MFAAPMLLNRQVRTCHPNQASMVSAVGVVTGIQVSWVLNTGATPSTTTRCAESWTLRISSGVSKGIDKSVVQSGRDFPYIRVGGGQ